VFNVLVVVFAVNDEVEHWLEVSVSHGNEVEVDHVPDIEHDWGVVWINPLLVGVRHVDGLEGLDEESTLVLDDNLVLLSFSEHTPVLLDLMPLFGASDTMEVRSEVDNLWDLVHGVVLHLSELVVLSVELIPLIVVNFDGHVVVVIISPDVGTLLSVHLHLMVSHLNLLHLLHVLGFEGLDIWGWALLLHGLDVLGESDELMGVHEILKVLFEDLVDFVLIKPGSVLLG